MYTPPILGTLQIPITAVPSAPALVNALTSGTLEATLEAVLPEGFLLRFSDGKVLQAQGNLPFPTGSLLTLQAMPLPDGAGIRLQVMQATPPPSSPLLAPLAHGEALPLLTRLQAGEPSTLATLFRQLIHAGSTAAESPATWSTWMKEAIQTLSNPAQSPAEATFHQLQAKEGTAYYELPLPWATGEPLRLWVESDQEASALGTEPVHRALLSVSFSKLGDVRMGLEQRSSGLRVRLWLRGPERLANLLPDLKAELATQGRPVEIQILPMPEPAPDLRSLAGCTPLQAMG
jgi:hypothetical protein